MKQAKKTALLMIPYGLQVLGAKEGDKQTLGDGELDHASRLLSRPLWWLA